MEIHAAFPLAAWFGLVQSGTGAISILGLGFMLGIKHALDADHLIAVSTIVSERRGMLTSSLVGAFWGLGHTASLLVVGLLVIALHFQIPEKFALALEFSVAAMLIGLGTRVLWKLLRGGTLHLHIHEHDGSMHIHPHLHPPAEVHTEDHHQRPHTHESWLQSTLMHHIKGVLPSRSARLRSMLIGMVHGLAGSAGLMLLVLATIPSPLIGLAYIGVFGIGSVGGMLIMSTLMSIPFALSVHTSGTLHVVVRGLSGLLSVGFGLFLAWHIGFENGLFL